MSTQPIKDYLVKQLFIEKNVVTYRSLSRQFGIHVNVAKEELATYHEKAPYDSQTSFATYLLTGEVLAPRRRSRDGKCRRDIDGDTTMNVDEDGAEDVGMDIFAPTQTDSNSGEQEEEEEEDIYEEEDGDHEDATTINVTIVNENDLEDVKSRYLKLTSVHVYSLSPSLIHDASHLCTPTPIIRKTDNSKGLEHASSVGRVVAPNIHFKPIKTKAPPASVAKATAPKAEKSMEDTTISVNAGTCNVKPEEKKIVAQKKKGKSDFFGGAKAKAKPPVKKEESKATVDVKKPAKMFFGATTSAKSKEKEAKSVPVKREEEEEAPTQISNRGLKRKSLANNMPSESDTESAATKMRKINPRSTSKPASRLSSRAPSAAGSRPPSSMQPSMRSEASSRRTSASSSLAFDDDEEDDVSPQNIKKKTAAALRVKKGVVLSDDEDNDVVSKKSSRRAETMKKAKMLEEKEARELMEMDDDRVERVARRAEKRPNPLLFADGEDADQDVAMDIDEPPDESEDEIEVPVKPKQKRKREKKVVPVGSNGIKKRRITKTRHFKDEDGYMQTEDYTDWESVDGEEEVEQKKLKAKPKAAKKVSTLKAEEEEAESNISPKALSRAPSAASSQAKEKKAGSSKAPKEVKSKPATKGPPKTIATKGKGGQGGIRSFFNVAQKP